MIILLGKEKIKVKNKAIVTFINNKKVEYNAKDILALYLARENVVSIEIS